MALLSIKTTVVPTAQGLSTVVPANPARSYLAIVNTGLGNVNLTTDGTAPAADSGFPLDAAAAVGRKGGSLIFENEQVPAAQIRVFAGAATTLVVLEG